MNPIARVESREVRARLGTEMAASEKAEVVMKMRAMATAVKKVWHL